MRRIKDVADEDIYKCLMSRLHFLNIQFLNKKEIGWKLGWRICGSRSGNMISIGSWLSKKKKQDTLIHEFGHWVQDAVCYSTNSDEALMDKVWKQHKGQAVGTYIGWQEQHNMDKYELFACAFECYINGTHTPYGERVVLSVINPKQVGGAYDHYSHLYELSH